MAQSFSVQIHYDSPALCIHGRFLIPREELQKVAIRIVDIELGDAVATRLRPTSNLDVMSAQGDHGLFHVINLESKYDARDQCECLFLPPQQNLREPRWNSPGSG